MRMGRRTLFLFCAAWGMFDAAHASGTRRNVIVITADDLRPWLGCYGAMFARTPHLDRLAAQGARFERAFVQQAWCAPSRTSFFTGLRPDTTRVYDLETHFRARVPDAVTLPQLFKQHGYATAAFGKVFHETHDDPLSWSVAPKGRGEHGGSRAYALAENREQAAARKGYAAPTEIGPADDEAYPDGRLTTDAIRFLEEHQGQPFFLNVGFFKPHLPFAAPARYWEHYRRDDMARFAYSEPPEGAPVQAFLFRTELHNYLGVPGPAEARALLPEAAIDLVHGYLACIAFVDAQVGRLMAALDRLGLTENTIVVFWGDHGWKLGEFGQWSKNSVYDVDTRVPLLLHGPGIRRGVVSDSIVELIDVYPTLADLAGIPVPRDLDGASFVQLLDHSKTGHKGAAFSQVIRNDARGYTTYEGATWMGQSVRTQDYRFVRWVHRDDKRPQQLELYDLRDGAMERVNLAGNPAFADTVRELGAKLDSNFSAPFVQPIP